MLNSLKHFRSFSDPLFIFLFRQAYHLLVIIFCNLFPNLLPVKILFWPYCFTQISKIMLNNNGDSRYKCLFYIYLKII